jgi:hypothetical protein
MKVATTVTITLLASHVNTGLRASMLVNASSDNADHLGHSTGVRERVSSLGRTEVSAIQ